jgi:hypothetical protein
VFFFFSDHTPTRAFFFLQMFFFSFFSKEGVDFTRVSLYMTTKHYRARVENRRRALYLVWRGKSTQKEIALSDITGITTDSKTKSMRRIIVSVSDRVESFTLQDVETAIIFKKYLQILKELEEEELLFHENPVGRDGGHIRPESPRPQQQQEAAATAAPSTNASPSYEASVHMTNSTSI